MKKQELKDALGASLRAEEQAVGEDDRFTRAETYFSRTEEPQKKAAPSHTKVIRDGFTMPVHDYALIAEVQALGLGAGINAMKSEVLRAGLHALRNLSPAELAQTLKSVEKIKTGRPAKQQ